MPMEVQGPPIWDSVHYMTFAYPERPTPAHRQAAIRLFDSLTFMLPCEDCQQHYGAHLRANPPPTDSRTTLSHWAVELHNAVNRRLGKRVVSYEEAAAKYSLDSCSQCDSVEVPGCCEAEAAKAKARRPQCPAATSSSSNSGLIAAGIAAFVLAIVMLVSVLLVRA